MTPERWKKVDALFSAALALDQDKRDAFLQQACKGDDSLKQEVEELLASDRNARSYIESPAVELAAGVIYPEAKRLSTGDSIGPYQIVCFIGAGGMGEVYQAKDPRIGRAVAIKTLRPEVSRESDRLVRFEQEVRAVGSLNHPNILSIYDFGNENGKPYLVTELLEGKTLRDCLASRLPLRQTVDYAIQMTEGLSAAHEHGIVHRDLKPENIFITQDGRVKILDFGLAKLIRTNLMGQSETEIPTAAHTETGTVMGTVAYMSPEQLRGEGIDHRTDIFSFGAILYEMFSGQRAFSGRTNAEKINAILNEDPPPTSEIPAQVERIIRYCTEKNPAQRYQSMRDIGIALREGQLLTTKPEVEHRTRAQRPAFLYGLIATVLVIAAIALAFLAGTRFPKAKISSAGASQQPTYHRLTFHRGTVHSARFAPDGSTILYSASWEGNPMEIYSAVSGSPEERPLGLQAKLLSMSRTGEMAVLLHCQQIDPDIGAYGTLARVPYSGGSPRELTDSVISADWSPDGQALAAIRFINSLSFPVMRGTYNLEYPVGNLLYKTPRMLRDVRLSPKGDQIALIEELPASFVISVFDLKGNRKVLSSGWSYAQGLAWSPSGNEIWFGASKETAFPKDIYAVTMSGKERLILRLTNEVFLDDISRDQSVLLQSNSDRAEINAQTAGSTKERDLSLFDFSFARDICKDGTEVLINEIGEATGGSKFVTYVRKMDGSPAIRLGDGLPFEYSVDKKWVIATSSDRTHLVLIPTGIGQSREIPNDQIESYNNPAWLPDNKRIIFIGQEKNHGFRIYVQDIFGNAKPYPIGPEGITPIHHPVSPDGRFIAGADKNGRIWLIPVEQEEPRSTLIVESIGNPVFSWTGDAKGLYVVDQTQTHLRIYVADISTGQKHFWKDLIPWDPTGIVYFFNPQFAPDGKSYAYSYIRVISDLYLVNGL